jgi:hypothetical protein
MLLFIRQTQTEKMAWFRLTARLTSGPDRAKPLNALDSLVTLFLVLGPLLVHPSRAIVRGERAMPWDIIRCCPGY